MGLIKYPCVNFRTNDFLILFLIVFPIGWFLIWWTPLKAKLPITHTHTQASPSHGEFIFPSCLNTIRNQLMDLLLPTRRDAVQGVLVFLIAVVPDQPPLHSHPTTKLSRSPPILVTRDSSQVWPWRSRTRVRMALRRSSIWGILCPCPSLTSLTTLSSFTEMSLPKGWTLSYSTIVKVSVTRVKRIRREGRGLVRSRVVVG
jgi:hypothetical protein